MKTREKFFIIILVMITYSLNSQNITTMSQLDAAPKFIIEEENVKGLCMDYIRAIEKEDPGIKFDGFEIFAPFARNLYELENNHIDCIVGIVKDEVRVKKFKFINIPLYVTNHVVAVNYKDTIDVNSFDEIRELKEDGIILTNRGAAHVKFLEDQKGLIIDAKANSTPQNLMKLINKRARFMYLNDVELSRDIRDAHLGNKIRILPHSFAKFPHYIAFSPQTSDELVNKVKNILIKLDSNGTLKKIYNKYTKM